MRATILLLVSLALTPVLYGCGQKGDLYLQDSVPSDERAGTGTYGQPARDNEDTER
ncbi:MULTISPECIES: LPS translocon maturation chaperone LptM [Marinobacter]|uniref:Lipoprotein n=1 Tax=Marinobacter suaedae TaxID=3057675 RepID=A0ABT8W0C8_9GAMM|nr:MULTISPECIES: lipoprotein [unclassified Marinobacter]MBZ2170315.1 lipoprotein [Marinobacter sp. F4216]MDO3721713.1 lipoprotein [Marinobacter sp. chi1]